MATTPEGEHESALTHTYKWMHRHFPHIVDCQPVDLAGLLGDSGFRIDEEAHLTIWTLKVGAYVAGTAEG